MSRNFFSKAEVLGEDRIGLGPLYHMQKAEIRDASAIVRRNGVHNFPIAARHEFSQPEAVARRRMCCYTRGTGMRLRTVFQGVLHAQAHCATPHVERAQHPRTKSHVAKWDRECSRARTKGLDPSPT